MPNNNSRACPCDSGKPYDQCCGPIIERAAKAETAEQLMRSRYTAYLESNRDYLLRSWHPDARPDDLDDLRTLQWIGLKVLGTRAGGPDDDEGEVEFVARYKVGGRAYRLHEISRFRRFEERWTYLSGTAGASATSPAKTST